MLDGHLLRLEVRVHLRHAAELAQALTSTAPVPAETTAKEARACTDGATLFLLEMNVSATMNRPYKLRSTPQRRKRNAENFTRLLPIELLFHIVAFLRMADLVSLLLTARRFGANTIAAPRRRRTVEAGDHSDRGLSTPVEMWSMAAEAARRRHAARPANQRAWVPRSPGQSWLAVQRELERLSVPLTFNRNHPFIGPKNNGVVADLLNTQDYQYRTASNDVVMQSGQHRAEFTVLAGQPWPDNYFGVIRADLDFDVTADKEAHRTAGSCFFTTRCGGCLMPAADLPPRVNWLDDDRIINWVRFLNAETKILQ